MIWIPVVLLIAAVAVLWRAWDDYRDRVKERARLAEMAENERRCREERWRQLEHGGGGCGGKDFRRAA